MDFFKNLSLKWKLSSGLSMSLVLMVVVSAAVYISLGKLLQSSKWVNHTHEAIKYGQKITGSLVNMETGLRGFLVAGNTEFLEPYKNGKQEFQGLIDKVKKHVGDNPAQVERLDAVAELQSQWESEHVAIATEYRYEVNAGADAAARFKMLSERTVGKEKFDGFRAALAELNEAFVQSGDVQGQSLVKLILLDMVNQETGQRGFLLSGNEASLEPYTSGILSLGDHVGQLREIVDQAYDREAVKNNLELLDKIGDDWKSIVVAKGISLKRRAVNGLIPEHEINAYVLEGTGKAYFDQARGVIDQLESEFRQARDVTAQKLLTQLSKYMVDMETGYRGFLLTGKDSSLEPYVSGESGFVSAMEALHTRVDNAFDVARVSALTDQALLMANDWKNKAAEPEIQARREMNKVNRTLEDISAFIELGIGKAYMDEMRSILNTFTGEEAKLIEVRNAEQEATAAQTTRITILGTLAALVISGFFVFILSRFITRSLDKAVTIANRIADDDLNSDIDVNSRDELGKLMGSLQRMQSTLKERIESERAAAAQNDRIKQSLDNVSGNVMIAGPDLKIIYLNDAMSNLLSTSESAIRRDLSDFSAAGLIGKDVKTICKGQTAFCSSLSTLNSTAKTDMVIGGLHFRITANPVKNQADEKLGVVLEWENRTNEVAIEAEVQGIVDASLAGDLSQRVNLSGKEGFFNRLSLSVNSLLDVSERVINDTIRVLSSMSQGDLTHTIQSDYEGSFDQLKTDTNATIRKLTEVINEIRQGSEVVLSASLEIARGNADLSTRTEQQAANLEETASSVEEMTATVRQNAESAKRASEIARNARDSAESGGAVLNDTISAMNEISTSSEQIANIVSVIDEIAFQTNLLALNAAVEAARAGEQGRGFAVVASEVGSLAGRSAKSAKEIKELIQDSVDKVNEGARLASESGETLEKIISSVKDVSNIITEISSASNEQLDASEQINQAVSNVDELTQHNAALVEQAAAASESMQQQSGKLNELVSFFTTGTAANSSSVHYSDDMSADDGWEKVANM